MRIVLAGLLLLATLMLAGCGGSNKVREFDIHVGWNPDGASQYMTPAAIRVDQGDKVRFVVINDDDPNKDYNGAKSGRDNFHDVAINYPGACDRNPIEHEAPAGGGRSITECNGKDYFVANTKGTFSIICEVRTTPQTHAQLGMRADFIVK